MTHFHSYLSTPIGCLLVEASAQGLTRVIFVDEHEHEHEQTQSCPNDIVDAAVTQLSEFFAGSRKVFALPLAAQGTDFRQKVWQSLLDIPYGATACYSDIANAMNNQKAVRAVGAANGANPISIIVPCHRVIGKDGSLTGYAGGLERKKWLLAHEKEPLACSASAT